MRRGLPVLALVALGLALWWPRSTPPEAPVGVRPPETPTSPPQPAAALQAPPEARTAPEDVERPRQSYDRVVSACGFDAEERCVESGCGAVVAMPDLDRIDGWMRLLWEQPGVVGSTAARDLGLPMSWSVCGDALMASPEVMSAQMNWDQELWCVGDRTACDEAATERYGWAGFSGGVRLTRRHFVLDGLR